MIKASEIKEYFESLIYDTWDDDATYRLMQNEEEKLELEREWVVLRKLNTSISVDTSTTWETEKDLPNDFLTARKVYVGSMNGQTLTEIAFDNIIQYKDIPGYFAIDYANKKIYFTGVFSQSYTVYLYYKKSIVDEGESVVADTEFPWPGKTALVLAYRMAQHHKAGVDGDEVNFQMTPEQAREYKELKNSLIQWDVNLQLKAMSN